MAFPLYSVRFLSVGEGASGSFAIAAGQLGVIRFITAHNYSTTGPASWGLIDSTSGVWLAGGMAPAQTNAVGLSTVEQEVRIVLPAGHSVRTQNDPTIDMTVSGYLFLS